MLCKQVCPVNTESCQTLSFDLSPNIARKLEQVSQAYQTDLNDGDEQLQELFQESACALGISLLPEKIKQVQQRLKKYTSVNVCGVEINLEPSFDQVSGKLRFAEGLNARVNVNKQGAYSAELNIDLCAIFRKK